MAWFFPPLAALGIACGGSKSSDFVEVAPASHNGGVPLGPAYVRASRGYAQGPPHPGSWAPTRTFQGTRFTMQYPASARAYETTDGRFAEPILWIDKLPQCTAACDITVVIGHVGEHVTLDSVVRLMTTPSRKGGEQPQARVIDTTTVGGHAAIRIAIDCSNCTEVSIVTERHSWVAQIGFAICTCDSALAPKVEEIARSFRWAEEPPAPKSEP